MRLLLAHPQLAQLDCRDCQRWITAIPEGTFPERGGRRQERKENQPTPCHDCPKKSPENAELLKLTPAAMQTTRLYLRSRATFGRSLTEAEAGDPLLQYHLAMLDGVFRQHEHEQQAGRLSVELARMMGALHGRA